MKNTYLFRKVLIFLMVALGVCTLKAQTNRVFYENFEGNAFPPEDWQVIEDHGDSIYFHWQIFSYRDDYPTLGGGFRTPYIDTKTIQTDNDYPEKPKTEWLITPDIDLPAEDSCKLSFLWQAHKEAYEKESYNTWVLVSSNKGITWDTLWHLLDPRIMTNSGTPWPWESFGERRADLDLTKYKGKSIRIAWLYRNFRKGEGNLFKVDNVSVEKWSPLTGPVARLTPATYTFPESYLNLSVSSGPEFRLTNAGIDTLRINSVKGLDGTDFRIPGDFSEVRLLRNEAVAFSVVYTPTKDGGRRATATFETNGGSVSVELDGIKTIPPSGYTVESFEGDFFPPAGWTGQGWKRLPEMAASGAACAVPTMLSDNMVLQSPRLDLSKGSTEHYIVFDWADLMATEQTGNDNADVVEFSEDGGKTWKTVFTTTPSDESSWQRNKIMLGSRSDNAYVRFVVKTEGLTSDSEVSSWRLDNVVLPPLYGSDAVPGAATNPSPADKAEGIYVNNLVLSWDPVLHATSYKIRVGTASDKLTDVLDTELTECTKTISGLDYGKTYYWQVIPVNAAGQAAPIPTWTFSTMADPSVQGFPYSEGFEGEAFPPQGWRTSGNKWTQGSISPYEGDHSAVSSSSNGLSILSMPPVRIPSEPAMQVSFVWGNAYPVNLSVPDGPMKGGADAKRHGADTVYFEISTDENEWKVVSFVSDEPDEEGRYYWHRCKYALTDYAGKTVYMRWRYSCVNYSRSKGSALDNVFIGEYSSNGQVIFSQGGFDAGVVNYRQTVSSRNLYFLNDGAVDLKVKSVSFASGNFTTDIAPGDEVKIDRTKPYSIFFTATDAGVFTDTMRIEFENGLVARQPAGGHALDSNNRCFTFEQDEAFATNTIRNFTTVDVDGRATCEPGWIEYPGRGSSFAWMVMNVEKAGWRSVSPVSGIQCLYAACPSSSSDNSAVSDDWLISDPMTATAQSKFRFYAKSYGDEKEYELHRLTVLVSETDNSTGSFTPLKGFTDVKIPYSPTGGFTEFSVDLSDYAGKKIYVAVRHTANQDGFALFMDDLWFENFGFGAPAENQAPRFLTTPPSEATEGQEFSYTFRAIDPDGDKITFTTKGLPGWLTLELNGTDGGTVRGVPTQTGEVMFVITASDNVLSNSQEVIFNVKPGVGNEEAAQSKVALYPNPVKDVLNIDVDADSYQVILVGTDGRIAAKGMNLKSVDMRSMNAGLYIMQVRTSTQVMNFRVVKY
ncbi:MAG: choice-of-anchor J domain-containing protein [Bacteroides sp.]|nr:choice-of-anchor J domain-containing protein [Bacteroides sp.]